MAAFRSRRLEALLGAVANELTAADVVALIENKVSESADLDFKATLYGSSDRAKRDLSGDVASMANSTGGLILLGIAEDEHAVASAAPEVVLSDGERNRMLQIVASGVAPMPAIEIFAVTSEDDPARGFYCIAVPRSTGSPHAVVVNDGFRFPVRNGTTIRYLSEPEIAAAYRARHSLISERTNQLVTMVDNSLDRFNKDENPWLVVGLVPEHPGALEISQRRLAEFRKRYEHRDVNLIQRTGASFEWVRPGRGMYVVGDGPFPNASSRLPHYGYAELHTDGSGVCAVSLIDLVGWGRRTTSMEEPSTTQMVSDEALAIGIASALLRLALHSRDETGAAGSVLVRACLLSSGGKDLFIGHTRQFGIGESRSHNEVSDAVFAETSTALDELASPGRELIAAAARLHDELGTSFGIAEMGQFSADGEIRRRYWAQPASLTAWAEANEVVVTDSVLDGT